jgi:hypothetical protein
MNEEKCSKCMGCGQVADTEDEEPWTVWLELPLQSSLAVLAGIVRPKQCPVCKGSGIISSKDSPENRT